MKLINTMIATLERKKNLSNLLLILVLNALIQILLKYIRYDSNKHNFSFTMLEEDISEVDKEFLIEF